MKHSYARTYRDISWDGTIQILKETLPIEAIITGRGYSFHVIYGMYQSGYYLVIPPQSIGCDMAYCTDTYWNYQSLRNAGLSECEAETIAEGIARLQGHTTWK